MVVHYQCASVNPDNHRANFCILRTIYVRKNLVAVDFSIRGRSFFKSECVDKSEGLKNKTSHFSAIRGSAMLKIVIGAPRIVSRFSGFCVADDSYESAHDEQQRLSRRRQTWLDDPQTGAGTLTQQHGRLI